MNNYSKEYTCDNVTFLEEGTIYSVAIKGNCLGEVYILEGYMLRKDYSK